MRLEFLCPVCGEVKLEEVMTDVVVIAEVVELVEEEGELHTHYGDQIVEGGELAGYQCMSCSYEVSAGRIDLHDLDPALTLVEDPTD